MRSTLRIAPLAAAASLLLAAGGARAQTVSLPYQGYLDKDGVPCEGGYSLGFKLEDAAGTAVGAELRQAVTVSAGHFVTVLQFPATSFADSTDRYLSVTVYEPDGAGGEVAVPLVNRQRLLPALASHAAPTGAAFQTDGLGNKSNSIKLFDTLAITKGWSGFASGQTADQTKAEISNDTGTHKALVLAGNSSAGVPNRKVRVFDDLGVSRNVNLGGNLTLESPGFEVRTSSVTVGAVAYTSPIVIKQFTAPGRNAEINTGFPCADWTAVVVGFTTSRYRGYVETLGARAICVGPQGNWWIGATVGFTDADLQDGAWGIDVMFIRKGLVKDERPGS